MIIDKDKLKLFIESVDSSEIKQSLFLCTKEDFNDSLVTAALIRFSQSFSRFSRNSDEYENRNPLNNDEFYIETFQEKIRSSGVFYFGPMFQLDDETSGFLRDRSYIINSMIIHGINTTVVESMSDELLDMFFTHLTETGLVSNVTR